MILQAAWPQTPKCTTDWQRSDTIRVQLFSSRELHHAALKYICNPESGFLLECAAHALPRQLQELHETRPDLAIIEVALFDEQQPGAMEELLNAMCTLTSVILLAEQMDVPSMRRAIASGVSGYLLTTVSLDEFRQALSTVASGGLWLGQNLTHLQKAPGRSLPFAERIVRCLSQREREILNHVANGLTSKEVARKLCLSESSVRTYWYRVLSKLNALNKAEALVRAARLGLLDFDYAEGEFAGSGSFSLKG